MATLIETIEETQKLVHDMREDNDKSLEELKSGNEARFKELQAKCDKQEEEIVKTQKTREELEKRIATQQERIEIIESMAARPSAKIEEKFVDEDARLFWKWFRSGGKDQQAMSDRDTLRKKALAYDAEKKDVLLGTALLGGNALPKVIATAVDKLILRFSQVAEAIGPKTVGSSDYQQLLSIFGGNSGWVGETTTRPATGAPNLRNCKPTWGELYAYPQASNWSLQDIFFDVQSWLINDIADGMAKNLSMAIWNGNGTNQPTGMTNTTPTTTADYASPMRAAAIYQYTPVLGFGAASPVVLTFDAIINCIYTLAPGYRATAKVAMNTVTQGIVRRLKATTTGMYVWEPSTQIGQPDRLLGYPVFTWEDMGNGNVNDAFCLAFGDFVKAYALVYRQELETTVENVTTPGYTKFYVRRRWGGIPYNNDAVKFLRNAD